MKIVFCCPTITRPFQCLLDSIEAAVQLLDGKGYDHYICWNIGGPYISHNRATMLRKAQEANADIIIFLDHDISFEPEDLLKLIEAKGDLVAGTYRFKRDTEEYMGALLPGIDGKPQVREDGALKAHCFPAGFLKITKLGLARFMQAYPELQYIDNGTLTVDLFNHGAIGGIWYGEDYALCKRWIEKIGDIWTLPNLNINHHTDDTCYKGNLHKYLLKQPGGSEHVDRAR
jgi:hypothetical protein